MWNNLATLYAPQDTHIHEDVGVVVGAAPAVDGTPPESILLSDVEVGSNDVLCGRGKRCQNHPGNVAFVGVCSSRKSEYLAQSKRLDKHRVVSEVLDHVRCALHPPGRFLEVADESVVESRGHPGGTVMWRVVKEATAREKAKRTLRESKRASVGRKVRDVVVRLGGNKGTVPSKEVPGLETSCDGQGIRPTHTPDAASLSRTSFAASFASVDIGDDAANASATAAKPALFGEMPPSFTAQDELQEMATLSPMEVAKAEADLRGITMGLESLRIEEEAEENYRRTRQLYSLDSELGKIPLNQKFAYLQAVSRCPELVDGEHKIAFLECDDFDAKLAAKRLVKYWELKAAVFGPEKCFLPLTFHGAMKGEMDGMVKHCPLQLLSVKDTAGRAIILFHPSRRDPSKYSTNNVTMAAFYLYMTAAEDPEVRKKGLIFLICSKDAERKHFDPALPYSFKRSLNAMPVKYRSFHACYPNKVAYMIYPIVKYFIGREHRMRMKVHYGSEEKVLTELESYCLPRNCVPSELGGDLILDDEKWLKERFQLERQLKVDQDQLVCQDVDSLDFVGVGGRATKRIRKESKQCVQDNNFPGILLPTGDDAANTCNQSSNITAGTMFQGKSSNTYIGDDGVTCERRDSFYESIMKLPDAIAGTVFSDESANNYRGDEGIEHERRDSFFESTMELPAANASNEYTNITAGSTFQGETPTNCIAAAVVGHERRDSFFEGIMELPSIEDLCNDNSRNSSLVKPLYEPSLNPSLLQGGINKNVAKGDPRMNHAVMVKLANPEMSSSEALTAGGFEFRFSNGGESADAGLDLDNVSLKQRRNQLSRRLRQEKRKFGTHDAESTDGSSLGD